MTQTTEVSECALRMRAYYYGFTPTGVDLVDRILSAVACAGKAYHSTADWLDDTPPYEEVFRGSSPAEWIQFAANDAADALRATRSADAGEAKPVAAVLTSELDLLRSSLGVPYVLLRTPDQRDPRDYTLLYTCPSPSAVVGALREARDDLTGIQEYWNRAPESAVDAAETMGERAFDARVKIDAALSSVAGGEEEQTELRAIEELLSEGQGDDDGAPILPIFEPGASTLAKVEQCLHLLEIRRDVIEGASAQAGGTVADGLPDDLETIIASALEEVFADHGSDVPYSVIAENAAAVVADRLSAAPQPQSEWRDIAEVKDAPQYIDVRAVTTYRYLPYKKDGARQMGKPGRWQAANEHGGFDNAPLPTIGEYRSNHPLPFPPASKESGQ